MKKSTLVFMLVSETILLLTLGIVGSRIAALAWFSPGIIFGLAIVCVGGLAYISYAKLTRTIITSRSGEERIVKAQKRPSELTNRILKNFQKRTYRGPDNFESVFKKSFAVTAAGAFIITLATEYIFKESVLFLLAGYCLFTAGGTIVILRAPTTTQYHVFSDVIEEVIGVLLMAGVFLPMPGLFAAFGVIWLVGHL